MVPLADKNNHIQIEKLRLSQDSLDAPLHRAFSKYEVQNPQYGESWLSNLTSNALDENDEAVIYVARSSPENFIACPLKLNTHHKRASSLSTFYTSAYSPIICSDEPQPLFLALFQHLALKERLATLTLSPMDVSSPDFCLLQDALGQAGWKGCHDFFCFGNWIHELGIQSYESYLLSRPSKLQNTVARKTKKFLAGDRGHLEIVKGGDLLDIAIARYVTVYNNSWKNEEPYQDFVPELLRLSATRGWLRLGIASYDNQPVASQIWLVCNGTAYIFKLAYHENYKRLSAGTVLTAYIMRRVIEEDGISRIDYLSGDDAYKADWMTVRKEQHGLAAYNPRSPEGAVLLLAHNLKRILKRVPGTRRLPVT